MCNALNTTKTTAKRIDLQNRINIVTQNKEILLLKDGLLINTQNVCVTLQINRTICYILNYRHVKPSTCRFCVTHNSIKTLVMVKPKNLTIVDMVLRSLSMVPFKTVNKRHIKCKTNYKSKCFE